MMSSVSCRRHDAHRDRFLSSEGFKILRFDNAEVIGSTDAIAIILEHELAPFLSGGRAP